LRKHHFFPPEAKYYANKLNFDQEFADKHVIHTTIKKKAGVSSYYVDTHEFTVVAGLNKRITFDIISIHTPLGFK
jgi:hypothetical protein